MINQEQLEALGFVLGGTVRPDPRPLRCSNQGCRSERWEGLFQTDISLNVPGFAVYLMIVAGEVKKAGHAGKGIAGFKSRVRGEFNCLRKVIASGPPYQGDFPWKHLVPFALLAGVEVELWVKRHDQLQPMLAEEKALNEYYRGEWAAEGWTVDRERRPAWPS
jgi:hypothetical protein